LRQSGAKILGRATARRSRVDAESTQAIFARNRGARAGVASLAAAFGDARRRAATFLSSLFAFAWLRRTKPTRVLVLSVSALAAGALGLMTAYAVSPDEESAAAVLVTNGTTYRIATVTGPGGTTTVAITKTKEGKTRVVPVRILDTVTGPGGVETVSVEVLGPERTITDRQILTETQVVDRTHTDVVTEIQPTTVVVTDVRTETVRDVETQHVTVVETETVVVTETVSVTVTVPPPP
jgi:hypothetical protein